MGKKKSQQTAEQSPKEPSATAKLVLRTASPADSTPRMAIKECAPGKTRKSASPFAAPSSPLVICRNKHWRYIACFHGPWLQMPLEILETMANVNYNTPRPHPIDPAVFFDVVKIRKLVEEATDLAVRAATDLPSNGGGGGYGRGASNLGLGGLGPVQHGTKLSKERRYRINLQACQKLARAYRLDEIACSVATMQGASTLDEIGATVLQRNKDEVDGKYVHFFHEKIPSRQLADHTSLQPLDEILSISPNDPEPYRTRAMIRGFMLNFEEAIGDFTKALEVHRLYGRHHEPAAPLPASEPCPSSTLSSTQNGHASGKRAPDVKLQEQDQPSGLGPQLYFMRACAYLALACEHARDTVTLAPGEFLPLASLMGDAVATTAGYAANANHDDYPQRPPMSDQDTLESRKTVKIYARRAVKDLLAYLSHLEYTPHLPRDAVADFTEKIGQAASGNKNPRSAPQPASNPAPPPPVVLPVSDLFAATPPANLPPYPPPPSPEQHAPAETPTCEACTYHPLLTEALHCFLLCHCLLQTSRTELVRHAHNVARIARIADAYPIFQASRSAARADFVDILEKTDLASAFSRPWDALCAPAPLPSTPHPANCPCGDGHDDNDEDDDDDGGCGGGDQPEPKSRGMVRGRAHRARGDAKGGNGAGKALARWSVADDGKEYPIVTDRALLIVKWIVDVPFVSTGAAKKKRRVVGKGGQGRRKTGGGGGGGGGVEAGGISGDEAGLPRPAGD